MKIIIEEMRGNLIELFGAVVVFSSLAGVILLLRNFSDSFISCFLG